MDAVSLGEAIRSVRSRAAWAKALLGVVAAVSAVLGVITFGLADADLDTLDILETLTGVHVVSALATAVAFITWSYRAHANLRVLGRDGIRHSDQATIWWWIVPIAFLFMPFKVVYETVRGSTAQLDDPGWRKARLDGTAVGWTILFIGGPLIARFGASSEVVTESDLNNAFVVIALGTLAAAAGAVLGLIMVDHVTKAQAGLAGQVRGPADAISSDSRPTSLRGDYSVLVSGIRGADSGPSHQPSVVSNPGPTTEPLPALYCSRCGSKFLPNDQFCAQCGVERSQEHRLQASR